MTVIVTTRYIYVSPITGKEYYSAKDVIKERDCIKLTEEYDLNSTSFAKQKEYSMCKSFLEYNDEYNDEPSPAELFMSAAIAMCITLIVICIYKVIETEEHRNKYRI